MKIKYTIGNAEVEIEGKTQKEVFRQLADAVAIFTDKECGACKSRTIYHEIREVEGNSYYSIRCGECTAELSYGQHKTGETLFAKRDKSPGTNGWSVWKKERESYVI